MEFASENTIRPPAVANSFYPGDPAILRAQIKNYLEEVPVEQKKIPKAIIVPHAGYIYSGPIAAYAYKALVAAKSVIKRVVLLGPAHRVQVSGIAAPSSAFFSTPFGEIPVDQAAIDKLVQRFEYVQFLDRAHVSEHSLEVHLPFLQEALDRFSLIPFLVGNASGPEVGAVLDALWGGPETLVVISSDLSHYHSYQEAKLLDQRTAEIIEQFKGEKLDYESACGRNPIKGLLAVAPKYHLQIERVDLRSSGDTAGSKDQVVGYGSWILTQD
ncbi:MAG: AmmeMemoRadiSam system protein B [SAR324 cluster bacterium]|nr:AmmeMemoRadiSam system protein B [SAR324 cluster bacterium]